MEPVPGSHLFFFDLFTPIRTSSVVTMRLIVTGSAAKDPDGVQPVSFNGPTGYPKVPSPIEAPPAV